MESKKDTSCRKWMITINNPLDKGFTHEKIKEVKLYHSRYGNRQRCFCEHPDQEYIIQYFSDRDIRSMPGFIGYTGWNDSIVPCKYTPRWCPIKKGGV